MRNLLALILLLLPFYCLSQDITISGTLSDAKTGEALLFANIYIDGTNIGATSNEYGFYSITIPKDQIEGRELVLVVSYTGYQTKKVTLEKNTSIRYDIKMESEAINFEEAIITGTKGKEKKEVTSTQMSAIRIPMKNITTIPALGGETDVIKVIQLMPGVQGGGEGSTGMFVRGGDADQNLVLLDEATVYNIGHLFGFFSVFNSDAIKDITLYKGAFPSKYGGRLSSILDVKMKEGNLNEFHGKGGIGLLSSRLTLEGPLVKDKGSFTIAGRRTYIDKVFKTVGQNVPYYFYDLNLKANYKVSDNDRLYFSTYFGNDVLKFDENDIPEEERDSSTTGFGFGFTLGNITNTLRWNHIFNDKLFANTSLIHTKFDYDIFGKFLNNNILIKSNVRDLGVISNFDYYRSATTKIIFGASATEHIFRPNIVSTAGEISDFLKSSEGKKQNVLEYGLYGGVEKSFKDDLYKINFGLRFSGAAVEEKFYFSPEPRLAIRRRLNEFSSIKASYSFMKQYMHRVSSSSISLPTDLWYPITKNVKPQYANQMALGYFHLFDRKKVNFSAELYYKWMNNLIEYREGANLILNDNFEDELLSGSGDSWGAEFLVKKDVGNLSGWIGYTLSWATRDFDELNGGKTFWAKYDRRHVISVVGIYKLSKQWTFSAVWTYSSGARFTAQLGQYAVPNASFSGVDLVPVYSERNEISMSPSHRLDINFVHLSRRKNKERRFQGEWHFGAYNVYNRATPYRIEIKPLESGVGFKYTQPGLFGFLPSLAYNFKFSNRYEKVNNYLLIFYILFGTNDYWLQTQIH